MPYIEKMKRCSRGGSVFYHYLLTTKRNGKRMRRYVTKSEAMRLCAEKEQSKKAADLLKALQTAAGWRGTSGRPCILPPVARRLLADAGFNARGGLIQRCKSRYFTEETAAARLCLLDDATRSIVLTPAGLLAAERLAASRLASLTRAGTKGHSFESCFATVILEKAATSAVRTCRLSDS